MATPPSGSGHGYYQQRVWKVSKALDRLALMCEQHHRQTKHVDGLPDWTTPSMPAGVKTRDIVDVPANFAWNSSTPKKTVMNEAPFVSTPVVSVVEKADVPSIQTLHEEDREETDPFVQQSEALRATTKDMMARLSFSSMDSHTGVGGQATHESVRPLNTIQSVDQPTLVKPVSVTTEHASTAQALKQRPKEPAKEPWPVYGSALSESMLPGTPRLAAHRRTTDPPRRRKVQFADHDRSYRESRGKKMLDMTYHESLQGLASQSRDDYQRPNNPGIRTTYQETFQWPRREHLERELDKVGGQTAGGPTRYEPRRVLTTEDAIRVAKEAALEFQPRHETSLSRATVHEPVDVEMELPTSTSPVHQHQDTQKSPVENAAITRSQLQAARYEPENLQTQRVSRTSPQVLSYGSDIPLIDQRQATSDIELNANPDTPSRSIRTQSIGVMTTPICVADASTQTDKLKKVVGPKPSQHSTPGGHTGYCSHCGRGDEPAIVATPDMRQCTRAGSSSSFESKTHRAKRPAASSYRYNPIFTNARFPPEPPVFRGKTTYSSEFGTKRNYKRYE